MRPQLVLYTRDKNIRLKVYSKSYDFVPRDRFRASVTDRLRFWVNVKDPPPTVTKRYIALLCVT